MIFPRIFSACVYTHRSSRLESISSQRTHGMTKTKLIATSEYMQSSGIIRQNPFVGHHVTVLMSFYLFRLSFFSFVLFFSLLCGYLLCVCFFCLIISINRLRKESWRFFLQTNQLCVCVFFGFLFMFHSRVFHMEKKNQYEMIVFYFVQVEMITRNRLVRLFTTDGVRSS